MAPKASSDIGRSLQRYDVPVGVWFHLRARHAAEEAIEIREQLAAAIRRFHQQRLDITAIRLRLVRAVNKQVAHEERKGLRTRAEKTRAMKIQKAAYRDLGVAVESLSALWAVWATKEPVEMDAIRAVLDAINPQDYLPPAATAGRPWSAWSYLHAELKALKVRVADIREVGQYLGIYPPE